MTRPNGYFWLSGLIAILAFVVVAGGLMQLLAPGDTGTVTGKVSVQGKPVTEAWITFFDREDRQYRGFIQRDGSFEVWNVPRGVAKVTVSLRSRVDDPGTKDPYVPRVHVPKRYAHPDKSGLSLTIRPGTQDVVIDLKDDFGPDELSAGFGP
jgi:hypothetical protein